jgi:hypothetical protein
LRCSYFVRVKNLIKDVYVIVVFGYQKKKFNWTCCSWTTIGILLLFVDSLFNPQTQFIFQRL